MWSICGSIARYLREMRCTEVVLLWLYTFLLHEYRDLFIDMAVRNNRSK